MPPIYNMGKFNMSKYESKYKEGKHKKKLTSRYPDFSQKKYKTLPSASINNNYIERIQSLTGR